MRSIVVTGRRPPGEPPPEGQAVSRPPRRARPRSRDLLGPECEIGFRLREYYGAFEKEPIPPEIIDLLERLDEVERRSDP
ncbi:NepR family anti-sigma factor [Amaricoccus sp.]|uniref:NepR family anti-sigma factor n=1 Tax=Amaricoccus sp. TaxID=1872485 RepID=UPI0025C620AF|nr:NepR family anti-sigma factor [Amaricoccus sp.]